MNDELYRILEKLIIRNDIQINREELKLQLYSHPSYPSLYSLTGVLNHFDIPNLALRLVMNKETLDHLPNCFITNIQYEHGEHLVLIEKLKKGILVTYGNQHKKKLTAEEFLNLSNGVILVIEKDEQIYEANPETRDTIISAALPIVGVILFAIFLYTLPGIFSKSHFFLSAVGILISSLIVKHELGWQSGVTKSICNLSEKTSCDAVLNSKGAKLLGTVKLSDISLVTFGTYCLCWVLFSISGITNFATLSIITLLAFPFSIYSLYYQYSVVNKWCPLCLGIAGVLFLQASILLLSNTNLSVLSINPKEIFILLISIFFAIGSWRFLKSLLIKEQKLNTLQVDHFTFKRNFSFFKMLYAQSEPLAVTHNIPGEMVFGNPQSSIELIIVTSPLCHYCKQAHQDIHQLLKKFNDRIKVIIRSNVDTAYKEGQLYKITTRLLEIYHTEGSAQALEALEEVYQSNVDLTQWLNNQPQPSKSYDLIFDEQSKWSNDNGIHFTPAFYINNRQFPKEYNRTDLAYFIEELEELEQKSDKQSIAS